MSLGTAGGDMAHLLQRYQWPHEKLVVLVIKPSFPLGYSNAGVGNCPILGILDIT